MVFCVLGPDCGSCYSGGMNTVRFWLTMFLMAAVVAGGVAAQAADALSAVRVYAVQPSCFELMLTSSMENPTGKTVLAFNHINGRTFFAGVGGTVLDYRVTAFDSAVELVYSPTVNSYAEKKAGTVTLLSGDGRKFRLELGRALPQPGWSACLVWLDSGSWMYAGDGDTVPAAGGIFPVQTVAPDAVAVKQGQGTVNIPLISDDEKKQLTALWEQRRKVREVPGTAGVPPAEAPPPRVVTQYVRVPADVESVLNPTRRLVEIRTPPQFFAGVEYRYPVSFETVPLVVRTAAGTTVRQAIVVPKRFQAGLAGYGVQCRQGEVRVLTH